MNTQDMTYDIVKRLETKVDSIKTDVDTIKGQRSVLHYLWMALCAIGGGLVSNHLKG